jgi:hypothetical protein
MNTSPILTTLSNLRPSYDLVAVVKYKVSWSTWSCYGKISTFNDREMNSNNDLKDALYGKFFRDGQPIVNYNVQ